MKFTLLPLNSEDRRTSIPLFIKAKDYSPPLKIWLVDTHGQKIPLNNEEFWVEKAGKYSLILKDAQNEIKHDFFISEQKYLNFGQEFGLFFVIFIFASMGMILWIRQLMKNKI